MIAAQHVLGAEARISVRGRMLSYFDLPHPSDGGTVVLCLHGWLDNAASFIPVLERGVPARALTLDLAGHGHSEHHPTFVPYDPLSHAADTIAFIKLMRLERVVLAGHSLGAGVATLVAAAIPDRIAGLVAIEGLGTMPGDSVGLAKALAKNGLRTREFTVGGVFDSIEDAVRSRLNGAFRPGEAIARQIVQRGTVRVGERYRWRHDFKLLFPPLLSLTEEQNMIFARSVRARTVLFLDSEGSRDLEDVLVGRAGGVADITIRRVPGGHYLHAGAHAATVADSIADLVLSSGETD